MTDIFQNKVSLIGLAKIQDSLRVTNTGYETFRFFIIIPEVENTTYKTKPDPTIIPCVLFGKKALDFEKDIKRGLIQNKTTLEIHGRIRISLKSKLIEVHTENYTIHPNPIQE